MHRSRPASVRRLAAVLSLGAILACDARSFAADPATAAGDLDAALFALEAARLDPAAAIDAAGLELPLGHGRLTFAAGVLIPARTPGDARVFEAVFVGDATLEVQPPDPVEAHQLAAFTGGVQVRAPVSSAVIVCGDRWFESATAGRTASPATNPAWQVATARYARWTGVAGREGFGARSGLLRALLGDASGAGYRGVWIQSPELGEAYYAVDPAHVEAETFGGFKLFDASDLQTRRRQKLERRWAREARRRAHASPDLDDDQPPDPCVYGDSEEDVDDADGADAMVHGETFGWIEVWMSAVRPGAIPDAPSAAFEPEHYAVDLRLVGDALQATGTTRIRLRAGSDGLRAVSLRLDPEIGICAVREVEGAALPFDRTDGTVLVALPRPAAAGERIVLDVRTAGQPIVHRAGRRSVRDTVLWHPHAGEVDRATYDVKLRWPSGLELLAAGEPVDDDAVAPSVATSLAAETTADERRIHRRIDTPSAGFAFEIDAFDVVEQRVGDVTFRFGFPRDAQMTPEFREDVFRTMQAALIFFEVRLGRRHSRRLVGAVADRPFSQGLPGFLALGQEMLRLVPESLSDNRSAEEYRRELIAHEVSHQWWGDRVGWHSYRDQWLSEALADFSAAAFLSTLTDRPQDLRARRAERQRARLRATTVDGRPLSTLGPVVLGRRLAIDHGEDAYAGVVYRKGGALFDVLASRLGIEPTLGMLGALAQAVDHRTIDTDTFFAALEQMSGRDLDAFVDRYVRGSGLATLYVEPRLEPGDDDTWSMRAALRQLPAPDFRFVVEPRGGGWDVRRRVGLPADPSGWTTAVPYHVAYAAPDGDVPGGVRGVGGSVEARGFTTEVAIPLAAKPLRFVWDPREELLGPLETLTDTTPKSWTRLGRHWTALGRWDEAGAALDRALESAGDDPRAQAAARLARARLALDRDDDDTAKRERVAAESLLPDDDTYLAGERAILRARIEARAGSFAVAALTVRDYARDHGVALDSVRTDRLFDASRLTEIDVARGELFALKAICARAQGARDADLVVRVAELAGVDVRALQRY